jgi:hypothetical protein
MMPVLYDQPGGVFRDLVTGNVVEIFATKTEQEKTNNGTLADN